MYFVKILIYFKDFSKWFLVIIAATKFPSTVQISSPKNLITHLVEIPKGSSEFKNTERTFLADWVKPNAKGNLNKHDNYKLKFVDVFVTLAYFLM